MLYQSNFVTYKNIALTGSKSLSVFSNIRLLLALYSLIGISTFCNANGVSLDSNAINYTNGSNHTLTRTIIASDLDSQGDLYIALQFPDGSLYTMQNNGSFSTEISPYISDSVVGKMTYGLTFNYIFTGSEPEGTYIWYAGITEPGTLNFKNAIDSVAVNFKPSTESNFILSTISNDGVRSTIEAGDHTHSKNAPVSYSFSPLPGYADVSTILDGVIVPSSGSITMTEDHFLWSFGKKANGTPFNDMFAVPSDITSVPYPKYYQSPHSLDLKVEDPYCVLSSNTIAYPRSYLGTFGLPKINGAPLSNNILRGVSVKDYWEWGLNNPSTNSGCTGDLHTAFIDTLVRLKRLGADHVVIYRDTLVENLDSSRWRIMPSASWSVSDEEMSWIVKQAQSAGLAVHEYRQIVNEDTNGKFWPITPSTAQLRKFLDAYIPYIVDRARIAEQNRVAAFQLDYGVLYWPNWSKEMETLFIAKMTAAAKQVRAVYSGKILYGVTNPWISKNQELLSSIDWFIGSFAGSATITNEQNIHLTVDILKQKFSEVLGWYANILSANPKPVVWRLQSQSHRNYFRDGWIEDGFCTNSCEQNSTQTDFSIQAMGYEAALEVISEQNHFNIVSIFADSYWYVDVILARDSYPNLSQSFRNKPAESILYQWYKK